MTTRSNPILSFGVALAAAIALSAAIPARAQLQYYEGFDYPLNLNATVSGLNGGFGTWQAAWTTGSGAFIGTNVAGGLAYTDSFGNQLLTDPDGIRLAVGTPPPNPQTTTASPNRTMLGASTTYANLGAMAAANPLEAGTVWMSFLFQRPTQVPGPAGYYRQANFGLFQGTSERLDVGDPNTGASVGNFVSLWSNGGTHPGATPLQSTVSGFSDSSAYLMVLKLTVDIVGTTATKDGVAVWINPADITSLGGATLSEAAEVDVSGVTTIRFQAGNANANGTNAFFYGDEFRLGFTAGDVLPLVPEPSTMAFLGLGGLALLLRFRRK